jgi:hypothetical protein
VNWFRLLNGVPSNGTPESCENGCEIVRCALKLACSYSSVRDEIDGIYLHLRENADMPAVAQVVRAILDSSHHGAGDFSESKRVSEPAHHYPTEEPSRSLENPQSHFFIRIMLGALAAYS